MKKTLVFFTLILNLYSSDIAAQIYPQQQSMWCWAACIQSALGQANVNTTQASIVATLTGWPQNRPASSSEVASVLNAYGFTAWTVPYPATYQELNTTLMSGWKLIAFVNPSNNPQVGHFIMIQGVGQNGLIIISDPANGLTYQQTILQLYQAWNWGSSIIVGHP